MLNLNSADAAFRFNKERELRRRHLHFNLRKLVKIAVDAVGDGAQSCMY